MNVSKEEAGREKKNSSSQMNARIIENNCFATLKVTRERLRE